MQAGASLALSFNDQLYRLGRPANVTLPALVMLTGFVLGGGSLYGTDWLLLVLVAAGFLLHSGFTIANDLSDRDVDIDNDVQTIITKGSSNDRRAVRIAAVAMIVLGAGLTLLLPPAVQISMWLMGLLAVGYNFRPFLLSRRPIGSIVALGLLYGVLPFFVGYFMYGTQLSPFVIALALFWGMARASISILKDFKDVKGDKKHGKQTFLLRFGRATTITASSTLAVVGLVGVSIVGLQAVNSAWWLAYVVTLIIACGFIVQKRVRLVRTMGKENEIFHELLKIQILFDASVLVWLLLS